MTNTLKAGDLLNKIDDSVISIMTNFMFTVLEELKSLLNK